MQHVNKLNNELNELRAIRDWAGLAKAPEPRIHVWATEAHLIKQVAHDARKFSDTIIVIVYGSEKDKMELPHGVIRRKEKILNNDPLFNSLTANHVLLITSY